MPGFSYVNQNTLARLVPLNALLPGDLKTLAEQTRVETLPAGKIIDLGAISQKLYLIKGQAELLSGKQVMESLDAASSSARYAVNRAGRQALLLRAVGEIQFIRVDMQAVEAGSPQKLESLRLHESAVKLAGEAPPPRHQSPEQFAKQQQAKQQQQKLWMDRLVESPIFRRLSPGNIRRVVERLQEIRHNRGDVVIQQGEKGTSFYVVKKGQCQVVVQNNGKTQKLAVLEIGDTFGAMGLLADTPHSASVVMTAPGEILRLDKDDFFAWVVDPVIKAIGYRQAEQLRQKRGVWLDVRSPVEYRKTHLPDSLNLPLLNLYIAFSQIQQKNPKLPEKGPYLVYSNEEKRASAAAYRLLEQGIETYVLRGGLAEVPERALTGEASEAARKQQEQEALRKAQQEKLARQQAEAEAHARREAEQRATAEAEALLAQVQADAKRLEQEKRRLAEEEERRRQAQIRLQEDERRRLLEEQQKERLQLREQLKAQLQSQLNYLQSAAESERAEHRQLEEQLAAELSRLMQEKEEQEHYRESLESERKRAEEEARLLQIQLKAARAVEERRKEMAQTLAEVDKRPPSKRKTYIGLIASGLLLNLALFVFLYPDFIANLLQPPQPAAPPATPPPQVAETIPAAQPPADEAPPEPVLVSQVAPQGFFRDSLGSGAKGPEMAMLPGGTFLMGSAPHLPYPDEHPQHPVTLRGFSISRHEISFEEYDYFARKTGRAQPADSGWGRGNLPVINVSWDDAVAYTQWLTERTGHQYRLPSEAEWEYAALAGASTPFWWGEEAGAIQTNCGDCNSPWSGRRTAPVGNFAANPAGLYDMEGNVSEWMAECFHPSYDNAPSQAHVWEQQGQCGKRMVRGGSYATSGKDLRLTKRRAYPPKARSDEIGFRVVRVD